MNFSKSLIALGCCLLPSCASTPPKRPVEERPVEERPVEERPAKSYQVVDVMPDFWRFWDKHRNETLDAQVAAFQGGTLAKASASF